MTTEDQEIINHNLLTLLETAMEELQELVAAGVLSKQQAKGISNWYVGFACSPPLYGDEAYFKASNLADKFR